MTNLLRHLRYLEGSPMGIWTISEAYQFLDKIEVILRHTHYAAPRISGFQLDLSRGDCVYNVQGAAPFRLLDLLRAVHLRFQRAAVTTPLPSDLRVYIAEAL